MLFDFFKKKKGMSLEARVTVLETKIALLFFNINTALEKMPKKVLNKKTTTKKANRTKKSK